ncbi:hypothetical protein PR048_007019 [Dryococelus australis]|uniref:Uncharacterized protein n=1 Tax=Dryococelus australis TaxID=614101 RepID=A0ABQ9IEP7_9NEOP|nr:hypothetical protein PR048_007019 [Dryococelus australis]
MMKARDSLGRIGSHYLCARTLKCRTGDWPCSLQRQLSLELVQDCRSHPTQLKALTQLKTLTFDFTLDFRHVVSPDKMELMKVRGSRPRGSVDVQFVTRLSRYRWRRQTGRKPDRRGAAEGLAWPVRCRHVSRQKKGGKAAPSLPVADIVRRTPLLFFSLANRVVAPPPLPPVSVVTPRTELGMRRVRMRSGCIERWGSAFVKLKLDGLWIPLRGPLFQQARPTYSRKRMKGLSAHFPKWELVAEECPVRLSSSAFSCVTRRDSVTPSSVSDEPLDEVKASASTLRRRQRIAYQHVSEFERDRMIGLQEMGLSYRDISTRTHAAKTNQWIEVIRTQRQPGTGPRNVTTARDDRHLVRMAVTDLTASSTVLARHWSSATCLGRRFDAVSCGLDWWHICHCVGFHCPATTNASN